MTLRILIIGLDAATLDLIGPWVAAGRLPMLASLMSDGAHGRLLSTPNMHSASAWTSILTGLNPGRHGLFVFNDRDLANRRQVFFKGGDRTGPIISAYLARHGLSSGFLNVPMTYPAECERGGFMVSGLDAPGLNEDAFAPPELRRELLDRFPGYNLSPPGLGELMSAGRIEEAIQAWGRLTETQTAAAEYLLEARPVDFFMTVYTASDWGGHNLWKYFESSAEAGETRHRDSLLSIYAALDRSVARLLERASTGTHVYVISDHGMGRHSGASYHLAEWLEENGYMVRHGLKRWGGAGVISAGKRAAKTLLPAALRERVKSGVGSERMKRLQSAEKDSFYASIDWARTSAYSEPGRHVININLTSRNAHGTVADSDYDRVCGEIIGRLAEWRDASGAEVVERIVRREQVYTGPFTERASDLFVYWNPGARMGDPPREVSERGFWWSGDHRQEGILICRGPGIRRGVLDSVPAVYDLVPTILHLAGLPVPDGLDGRVIEEALTPEFAANPIRVDRSASAPPAASGALSQVEEQQIEEKLRGLGYM